MATEEEAQRTWCPHVRIVDGKITAGQATFALPQTPYNRVVDEGRWSFPLGAGCIASKCSQWRWREIMRSEQGNIPMPQGNPDGYCGLAGRQS